MWTDAIEVRSQHPIISQLYACLRKIPLYKPTTFWGDNVPIKTKNEISTIVIVDIEKHCNFLKKLPKEYCSEECFFVLVANEKFEIKGRMVMLNIQELKEMGKLTMIRTDGQNEKTDVAVAICIEIFRLSSWGKKMYVISRSKQIKTAIIIMRYLFEIKIDVNHDPNLKHQPSINECSFICRQMIDFTSEYFQKMFAFEKRNQMNLFPFTFTVFDMDNIKPNQSELEKFAKNSLAIICKNPPQPTPNSTPVRSNCVDIEVPVLDDCGDEVLIFIIAILHSSFPETVPFRIRSKDQIFQAARNYLSKDNSRQIWLLDIDGDNLKRIYFLILGFVFLGKTFIKLCPDDRMTIDLRKTIPVLCNELNNLLKCLLCIPFSLK